MLETLSKEIADFFNSVHTIEFNDVMDILLLAVIIFIALRLLREMRAGQLVTGVALLVLCYGLSALFQLKALKYVLGYVVKAGAIAAVIIFQPELRRILERFGRTTSRLSLLALGESDEVIERWRNAIPKIVIAVTHLSESKTGALIVIERIKKLEDQIANGTGMKAQTSVQLLDTIFFKNTALHDGAVIIRDGYIWSAGCFLPNPGKEELIDKHLGSRHRAAIGMSENSDALIIVVSEETGQVSVAENGGIERDYTSERLETLLKQVLLPPDTPAKPFLPFLRKKSEPAQDQQPEKEE